MKRLSNGRWVCPACGISHEAKSLAEACAHEGMIGVQAALRLSNAHTGAVSPVTTGIMGVVADTGSNGLSDVIRTGHISQKSITLKSGESITFDGDGVIGKVEEAPDHWLACAEALEAFAKELRARGRSPEDMGPGIVVLGRMMRRAT